MSKDESQDDSREEALYEFIRGELLKWGPLFTEGTYLTFIARLPGKKKNEKDSLVFVTEDDLAELAATLSANFRSTHSGKLPLQ